MRHRLSLPLAGDWWLSFLAAGLSAFVRRCQCRSSSAPARCRGPGACGRSTLTPPRCGRDGSYRGRPESSQARPQVGGRPGCGSRCLRWLGSSLVVTPLGGSGNVRAPRASRFPERAGPHPGRRDGHPGPGSSGRSRRRGTSAPAGSPATDRRRPRRGRAEQQLAHPLLPDPRRCAPMASNWVEAVNRMVSALAPTRYGHRGLAPRARGAPFHITRSHQSESPQFQGIATPRHPPVNSPPTCSRSAHGGYWAYLGCTPMRRERDKLGEVTRPAPVGRARRARPRPTTLTRTTCQSHTG